MIIHIKKNITHKESITLPQVGGTTDEHTVNRQTWTHLLQ